MKTVLIVTHQRGFEADTVIDALRQDGVPVFRFNCDAEENASEVSLAIDGDKTEISLFCDGREINCSHIGIGWCQQLPPYLNQKSSVGENLQRRSLWAAQFAIFDLLGVPWLNSPKNIIYAANKPLQLMYAKSAGLKIPITLISNTPKDIRAFSEKNLTVAKNLATPWVVLPGETMAAYTKIVPEDWLKKDADLQFCPVIYQEYRVRKKDYRVVVVGDDVFAACCEPNEQQLEDIRRCGSTGVSFKPCDFDDKTTSQLRILMKRLSIEYCSADFMEDSEGNLYFLEINTCGAWWWVDYLYDGSIRDSIVEYFKKNL